MQPVEVGNLPPELLQQPQAPITFLGLDMALNPVHRSIWESFSNNRRNERALLHYRIIPEDHVFPLKKPKKSFEWHVPKGLLKVNWFSKHLQDVPAVACLFYDLDWDDSQWHVKVAEVVAKVSQLRDKLRDRGTKVTLVLVQRNIPLPGAEDPETTEKAAHLCRSCDLSSKALFTLPYSDHLQGYTMRMEGAFCELAQNHYQQEVKRIKISRDNLNKTTHQLLFARYQIKMAFYYELKQDWLQAIKNYKQAYANLMELRTSDTNMLEVKTVGGFVNYKICSINFFLNKPLDSIQQFRKHVDIFRSKVGVPELSFEHSAWMAKQYSAFGDLFEEAVKQGLMATQTQHPGFYYQQAASCSVNRKQSSRRLCRDLKAYPEPDPLERTDFMEFYGQRPWRAGIQSIEPPDATAEKMGILALQHREAAVNHSNIIIGHLRNAVVQLKKFKCLRMRRQLLVQMGEEYYESQDHPKALALLSHVLRDYRTEKWCPLVSNILLMALKCAFLSANVQEFVSLSLEAIGSWIHCPAEEKSLIQANMNSIIQGSAPLPMSSLTPQEIQSSGRLWSEVMASIRGKPLPFTLSMSSIIQFVECKAVFTSKTFRADEYVTLQVYLRINCLQPMKFSKLSIMFGNPHYNSFCEIPSQKQMLGENGNLVLVPLKSRMFSFQFLPLPADVNSQIQISSVALQLGSANSTCALLVWSFPGTRESHFKPTGLKRDFPCLPSKEETAFQELQEETVTGIVSREPRLILVLSHQPPVLMGEWCPLHVSVQCEERNPISNLTLSVGLSPQYQQKELTETTKLSDGFPIDSAKFTSVLPQINLGTLSPSTSVERLFYVSTSTDLPRELLFHLSYVTEVDVDNQILQCHCSKEELVSLEVLDPLLYTPSLLSTKFQPIQFLRAEERFLISLDIKSCSDLPISLKEGSLSLSEHVEYHQEDLGSQVTGLGIQRGEVATECFCIRAGSSATEAVPLGSYSLTWRRDSSRFQVPWVTSQVPLPPASIFSAPLYAELEAPAHGWVRTPMTIAYTFFNRTQTVQELALVVDASDAFMYAGNKQLHFWILPNNSSRLLYNLYPLISGHVQLPKFKLLANPGKSNAFSLDDLLQELLPTHIFIMPQGKSDLVCSEKGL